VKEDGGGEEGIRNHEEENEYTKTRGGATSFIKGEKTSFLCVMWGSFGEGGLKFSRGRGGGWANVKEEEASVHLYLIGGLKGGG